MASSSSSVELSLLVEFSVPLEINSFITHFWSDGSFIDRFLRVQLEDLNVRVGEWEENGFNCVLREISSEHPSKVSFPGLPSHAQSMKSQYIQIFDEEKKIIIKEINRFLGIPYSDYFSVVVEWYVFEIEGINNVESDVKIMLGFDFHKSTWLRSTIEWNTREELKCVYQKWLEVAMLHIESLPSSLRTNTALSVTVPPTGGSSSNIANSEKLSVEKARAHSRSPSIEQMIVNSSPRIVNKKTTESPDGDDDNDDDLEFFDCEEGSPFIGQRSARNSQSAFDNGHAHTLHEDVSRDGNSYSVTSSNSRAIAVNIVEVFFVMIEFGFWRLHEIYAYDMKELFDVSPGDVLQRVVSSILPGYHTPLLQKPDLYGPFLAVLSMPLVFLVCLEASKQGCDRSDLLGNASVVSLCLWVGLSGLYRLLAFFVAPTIELKQCLCITGYSFFSWSMAMIASYPLEVYEEFFGLPIAMPLVLFGLPSAISLAATFWDQTPSSSLTLRTSALHISLRQCAQNNSRSLQRLLWAVPKIAAFIIVALTHYQFLWYVARVFLPGKKSACRLSAILQPGKYADILTQKELRKFAAAILTR